MPRLHVLALVILLLAFGVLALSLAMPSLAQAPTPAAMSAATPAAANGDDDPSAVLLVVEGETRLERDGLSLALVTGRSVFAEDTLVTGAGGRIVLGLPGGDEITLLPDSHLWLGNLSLEHVMLELFLGEVLSDVQPVPGREWWVWTPAGVAVVSGTRFGVRTDGQEMVVAVEDGHVLVTDRAGVPVATVSPGESYALGRPQESDPALVPLTMLALLMFAALFSGLIYGGQSRRTRGQRKRRGR
jgi:hypothetical protein